MEQYATELRPDRAADLDAYREALDALVDANVEIDRLLARRARLLARVRETGLRVHSDSAEPPPSGAALEFAHRSLRLETAMSLAMSEYRAGSLLDEADALVRWLPVTLTAAEDGALTWQAATCIAREAREVPPEHRAEFDAAAVAAARSVAPSRLRDRLRLLRSRLTAATAAQRHEEARARRRVIVEDDHDGMSWLHAYLTSAEAHAIDHRLTGVARAMEDFEAEEGGRAEPRTLAQRRADLLVDLVAADLVGPDEPERTAAARERRLSRGEGLWRYNAIRPTVVVTVPVSVLLGDDSAAAAPAMLDGVVPMDPVTARDLAAAAPSLRRLLTDPHTGVALDLGRTRYRVDADLRLWLRLRDGTCRAPGCGRRAQGCDVAHTVAWQHGGPTRADNLAHLCRSHHTLKHQTRWEMQQRTAGVVEWRSPTGRDFITMPTGLAPPIP